MEDKTNKENGSDNTLHEGENVSFSIAYAQKGPMAINVHKLKKVVG